MTPEDEGEGYTASDGKGNGDRINFDLDGKAASPIQNPLIQQVIQKGKPMVVVLEGGSVINMPWLVVGTRRRDGLVPGPRRRQRARSSPLRKRELQRQAAGHLAELVQRRADVRRRESGDDDGLLRRIQVLRYHNSIAPLFAFGYGLSYTKFTYSNLIVPCSTVTKDSVVNVQGGGDEYGDSVDGDEISMLFASYPNTKQRRPVKELKAFHRTTIKAGQTVLITMPLRVQDLKYWDSTSHSWQWENGPVKLQVGGTSDNLQLSDSITIMN